MKRIVKTSAIAAAVASVALFSGCSGSDGGKDAEETQEDVNTGNEGNTSDEDDLENSIDGDGGIVQSYVSGYMRPTGISVRTDKEVDVTYLEMDVYYLNREESDVFKEKYNDLSYYQLQSVPVVALCDGVTSLAVETVGYYDESHPAGSDISEMVYCKYLTYYEFIAGGYVPIEKDLAEYPPLSNKDEVGSLLHEMWLSEVNYGNSQMMERQMLIEFPVAPEAPGTYEFRFFFNMPDLALETTFEYEFE